MSARKVPWICAVVVMLTMVPLNHRSRSKERAEKAIEEVKKAHPEALVEFMELDLSSFPSGAHLSRRGH